MSVTSLWSYSDHTGATSLVHMPSRAGHSLTRERNRSIMDSILLLVSRVDGGQTGPSTCCLSRQWVEAGGCCGNTWGIMATAVTKQNRLQWILWGQPYLAVNLEALQWHSQLHSANMPITIHQWAGLELSPVLPSLGLVRCAHSLSPSHHSPSSGRTVWHCGKTSFGVRKTWVQFCILLCYPILWFLYYLHSMHFQK